MASDEPSSRQLWEEASRQEAARQVLRDRPHHRGPSPPVGAEEDQEVSNQAHIRHQDRTLIATRANPRSHYSPLQKKMFIKLEHPNILL